MSNTESAFNWKGQPSIFTTNARQRPFSAAQEANRIATSFRTKRAPVTLAGGSIYNEPKLVGVTAKQHDVLRSGGDLGKRK